MSKTATPSVIDTLRDLIRINSVNPAYEHGVSEAGVAEYMGHFFRVHCIETVEQTVFPGRPNLVAKLPGRDSSRRVVFEAHTDTAGMVGMDISAFEPAMSGGKVYGRGSCDTKAGLAAMMCALASLAREGLSPPCEIWMVGAADEEFSYRGVVRLCEGLSASAAVVAEPTSLRLVVATKGCVRFRIVVHGKAAHSAKPQLGINAISHMARVVFGTGTGWRFTGRKNSSTAGPRDLQHRNNRRRHSGECGRGIVCHRNRPASLPGEHPGDVLRSYADLIRDIAGVQAEVQPAWLEDLPLETPVESSVVRVASEVLAALGLDGEPCGVPYGSDATKLSRSGVPSIVFGPGNIDQAHAATEFVECAEVEQALEFYRMFMLAFI